MNDPLADLLAIEFHNEMSERDGLLTVSPEALAEALRANRDRVLGALGGTVQDRRVELRDHTIATSWLFPLGEDRDVASDWEPLFIRRPLGEDQ